MSLYIRLQTSYWNHRKTLRLRTALGEYALWLPVRLWSYAAEYQPDGDFSGYSPDDLKSILSYSGDATSMLQALQDVGFMDGMKIHDWEFHNAFHATYSDRARKAAAIRWKKEKNQKKEVQRKGKRVSIAQALLEHASSIPSKLLEINGFETEWKEFEEMRRKKRAKMTPYAAHLILQKLSERPERSVEALRTAISRNWTGFEWHWLDNGGNGQRPKQKEGRDPYEPMSDKLWQLKHGSS